MLMLKEARGGVGILTIRSWIYPNIKTLFFYTPVQGMASHRNNQYFSKFSN